MPTAISAANFLLVSLLALAISAPVLAQGSSTQEGPTAVKRVLMVGDSWAEFMWNARSLRDVFADSGRPDIEEEGSETAISGSTAAEWTQPSFLQSITDELSAFPTIDVVQLTIGGNDFLAGQSEGGWYVGIPQQDLDALTAQILGDLTTVVDHILAQDPEIRVLISLYDHPNFVDSFFIGCTPRWNDLGQPTPRQINEAGIELQGQLGAVLDGRPRVSTVDHAGLMQFTFGFPDDGIPPGTLLPPGDLDRPSPIDQMFLGLDCIHLGSDGYYAVGQNLWEGFYDGFFNGTLFNDGFESGDTSAWTSTTP